MSRSGWFALALAVSAPALMAVEIDGVAAKVGTDSIMKSEVFTEMRRSGASSAHYTEVLNEMIDRRLIIKAAGESKMTMQEWVIENRIRDIIDKAFGGDRNRLMETLAKQKIAYPEWRARMKDDMIVAAMRWNVIDKNVAAGPQAMRKEYDEHPERYGADVKVTVSVILLKPEDVVRRDQVSVALKTNSFAAVAGKYSADSHAAEGGVWKDVNPADVFKAEICAEIAKLPVGALSHWIELDGWSFLLRKDDETQGRKRSFAEAYDDIVANVKEAEAIRLYDEWIARLRAETYIKVF